MIAPKEVERDVLFVNVDWLGYLWVHTAFLLRLEVLNIFLARNAVVFHFTHVIVQLLHHRGA